MNELDNADSNFINFSENVCIQAIIANGHTVEDSKKILDATRMSYLPYKILNSNSNELEWLGISCNYLKENKEKINNCGVELLYMITGLRD